MFSDFVARCNDLGSLCLHSKLFGNIQCGSEECKTQNIRLFALEHPVFRCRFENAIM